MENTNKKISEEKVWMKYYSEEAKNAQLPKMKAIDYIIERNKHRIDEPAIHYYGTDITFRQLLKRVNAIARSFTALGVKPGDIVSFVSVATPETIASIYALNKIGAAANTIDPRMDVQSIKRMIMGSGSKLTVCMNVAYPKVYPILDDIKQEKVIIQSASTSMPAVKRAALAIKLSTRLKISYTENIIKWDTFLHLGKKTWFEEAPYQGDALVAITYTGGTTGFPKGVMITNDSMNAVGLSFIHCDVHREPGDRFLGIIPVFSAYGMVCGMHMPLCMNFTLVPIPRFVPDQIGKLVKTFRPNHVISTPVFIELLIGSREVKDMDLSFLYTLASGGDSMNEGLETRLNEFRKKHGMRFPLAQGYGMSELSAAASFCVNSIYKEGSVGVPSLNVTVGIFDPSTGEELGYNQTGEVCVTGPTMMKGYFNNPKETEFVMRKHEDGLTWIHSGDLGYMDEDGFLYIVGRIKRMITRFDGHKVFPINMESLIASRSDVHNCAVIGVDDMTHTQGQFPMALVELMPGHEEKTTCKEIFKYCDENLEERGKPVAVLPIESLPLTPMGKIDYIALGKRFNKFDYIKWANDNLK